MTGFRARVWWMSGALLVLGCGSGEEEATAEGERDAAAENGSEGAAGGSAEDGPAGDEDTSVSVGPTGGGDTRTCTTDEACDDGDACTVDTCDDSGELGGFCASTPIPGCEEDGGAGGSGEYGGTDEPETPTPGGAGDPIDASCDDGSHQAPVFLPYEPLGEVDLPSSCDDGFEWQVCQSSLVIDAPSGSAAGALVVDLATYTMPDRLRIVGERADGSSYVLMDTCRVRTAEYSDPTDGNTRPPEDSIRRFELELEAGTRSLTIDSAQAGTPYYLRVLGLCAFDLEPEGETCGRYRTSEG